MDNFKLATKHKLRFQTSKGVLTTEQLWTLSLEELDQLAISLEGEKTEAGKKSFLKKSSEEDKTAKLKFDVVLDILQTKVDEQEAASKAAETKAKNQKILAIIADKEDESLKGKSVEELQALLN